MCGRYTLTQVGPRLVGERFELGEAEIEPATLGRFNVCPTEDILVVTHKGAAGGALGARAVVLEGAQQRPADDQRAGRERGVEAGVRAAAGAAGAALPGDRRRLVRVAEVGEEGRAARAVPLHDRRRGAVRVRGPLRRAKIDGEWVPSATILTTTANSISAPVHDRMPVVLGGPDEEAAWMQGGDLELLGPIASERTSVAPANPAVNKAGVEGPELIVAPAA